MSENGVIKKIVRCTNKGEYAVVEVELWDGMIAEVYVGGTVKTWFDPAHHKIKAHVKFKKD